MGVGKGGRRYTRGGGSGREREGGGCEEVGASVPNLETEPRGRPCRLCPCLLGISCLSLASSLAASSASPEALLKKTPLPTPRGRSRTVDGNTYQEKYQTDRTKRRRLSLIQTTRTSGKSHRNHFRLREDAVHSTRTEQQYKKSQDRVDVITRDDTTWRWRRGTAAHLEHRCQHSDTSQLQHLPTSSRISTKQNQGSTSSHNKKIGLLSHPFS